VHAVEELGELSASQMRLIAWTLYTKFGFEREAKDYFRKAAEAGDPSAAKEADFVAGKKL